MKCLRYGTLSVINVNAQGVDWVSQHLAVIKQGHFHAWSLLHLASSLLYLWHVALESDSSYYMASAVLFGLLSSAKIMSQMYLFIQYAASSCLLYFSVKQTKILIIETKVSKNL